MKNQLAQVKELYSKYQIFIYPVVIGLASLVIIGFVIYPQIKAFVEGRSNLEASNQKAKSLEVKAEELSGIDLDDLNKKLALAINALPTDKDYGSIIGLMQRIGADAGVSIVSLSLSPTTGEKDTGFSVKMSVVGSSQTINNVIQSIEKSPRVMKISEIDISSAKADGSIEASFTINAFYAPAPAALGSIDSELPKLSSKDEEILATLASSTVISTPVSTAPTGPTQLLPRGKTNPFE